MKISLISTVLNEEQTIDKFLDSILNQSVKPDEVVITDGGSRDKTLLKIENRKLLFKKEKILLTVLKKKGKQVFGKK